MTLSTFPGKSRPARDQLITAEPWWAPAADDQLTILDVERVILNGRIVERQRDRRTRQSKYVVAGRTEAHDAAELVGRLSTSGKLVILTVYRG